MKILFDHCVAKPLKKEFPRHEVKTTREMRWEDLKNGALLSKAEEAGFNLLLTVDQNLQYQQNLSGRAIAVVVMIAGGITVGDLRQLVPAVENVLLALQPGQVYQVT